MEFLAPKIRVDDLGRELCRVGSMLTSPWDGRRVAAVAELSREILRDPVLRRDPPSVHLAFWLRPANLESLRQEYLQPHLSADRRLVVPRGLTFHIAPANVDTMFVYSWVLSFLCGNPNVVRITTDRTPIIQCLLGCLNSVMSLANEVREANLFVSYAHNDEITEAISAKCQLRVIWGGDETIRRIRSIPLNPHAAERAFASKTSFCIMDAGKFLACANEELDSLVEKFFNDMFPFSQRACSSPHAIYWNGSAHEFQEATRRFDQSLRDESAKRRIPADMSEAVNRRNAAFEKFADATASPSATTPDFLTLVADAPSSVEPFVCGGGLLTHFHIRTWEETLNFVNQSTQTITYFGIDDSERQQIMRLIALRGADRLVPVGEALQFEPVWDGFDVVADFLTIVSAR
jgi:hypothetical protein